MELDIKDYKFKGIFVPAFVLKNKKLSAMDKLIYAEIKALSNGEKDPCFATNQHFAGSHYCSKKSISNTINKLETNHLIKRKYKNDKTFEGRMIWALNEKEYYEEISKITPPSYDVPPSILECTPLHPTMDTPPSYDGTINIKLNTLLKKKEIEQKEEEKITTDSECSNSPNETENDEIKFIDEYLKYQTDDFKNVKDKAAYKKQVILKILQNDSRTLENYNKFKQMQEKFLKYKDIDLSLLVDFKIMMNDNLQEGYCCTRLNESDIQVAITSDTGLRQIKMNQLEFFDCVDEEYLIQLVQQQNLIQIEES